MEYLLGSGLGDPEDLDQRLVLHQGALGAGQPEQQTVLQLLHLPLVGRHLLQELHSLRLQLLVGATRWTAEFELTITYLSKNETVRPAD